jgi:hypothetical protein
MSLPLAGDSMTSLSRNAASSALARHGVIPASCGAVYFTLGQRLQVFLVRSTYCRAPRDCGYYPVSTRLLRPA